MDELVGQQLEFLLYFWYGERHVELFDFEFPAPEIPWIMGQGKHHMAMREVLL